MSALHFFDMDGTLLPGTSASLELATQIGARERVHELEARAARGEIDNLEFTKICHALWRELVQDHIVTAFQSAPWISSIKRVWSDIAERGEYVAVISMSPAFFVDQLADWGAHVTFGSRVLIDDELDLAGVLTTESKCRIARSLMARFHVGPESCVAYGDSISDTALFRTVAHTVSVNGDTHIAHLAKRHYVGVDLAEAYALGRGMIDSLCEYRIDGIAR